MAFQQMSQEDDNTKYLNLACFLATDFFLEHQSRDVRLLVACAIADVFRVYAPNSPYQVPSLVKKIFLFFIQQLKGLQDPKDATFKRYFYLLENLAWVKSFNICIELDDSQFIFCQLFSLMFKIVNDNHSEKVKNFMLDMLTPLIIEADTVSMKLIEIILWQVIEPKKSQSKQACWLATQILKKTIKTMEPYLISYFNKAIVHGMKAESGDGSDDDNPMVQASKRAKQYKARNSKNAPNANTTISHLCELIYELNQICPSVMSGILPQLDFKIKSNEEKERCEFTRLLARLFSDKQSKLAEEFPELWRSFLGRFRDISVIVRTRCVQYSMHFLVNHPSLREDITEQLKQRSHDPDENVRYEVVMAIISAAKKGIENVNEDLLSFVKERTLDKKFKIRKEALFGMAFLYKQYNLNIVSEADAANSQEANSQQPNKPTAIKMLDWIKNKCMHNYFQSTLMDRLLTEKIIHMFLIPYSAPLTQRMRILYCFYSTIDQHAARVFNELLKQQLSVRKQVKEVLDILKEEKSKERDELLEQKVQICAKSLPEPVKAQEYITKLCRNLELNPALRNHMEIIVNSTSYPQVSEEGIVLSPPQCSTIEVSVKEVLKSLGYPVQTNSFYCIIKQLMERIAPVLIDYQGLIQLFDYVHDSLLDNGEYDAQFGLQHSSKRGLQLILGLSTVFPAIFYGKEIFTNYLLPFLWQTEQPEIGEVVLQILTNIGASMNYEGCNQESDHQVILPWWASGDVIPKIIDRFILKASTSKQAKYAVQCLNSIINDESEKNKIFGQILDRIKTDGFSLESPHFRIHLVTTGMIAISGGYLFFPKQLKTIMYKHVVQNLLLKDQRLAEEIEMHEKTEKQRASNDPQVTFEFCSEEVKCKIEAIKLMVRWIHGIKLNTLQAPPETQPEEITKYHTVVENSMNLLMTIIKNEGDLNNKGLAGTTLERAHLRLAAGIAMIKIVSNDSITQVNGGSNSSSSVATIDGTTNMATVVQQPTSQVMAPKQWHVLATLLLDQEDFVRERFAAKLNKNLISLSLSLEFLAMLCLGGSYDTNSPFRAKLRTFLLWNLSKRRDACKGKNNVNLKAILPECAMPYVIHLLAHMPFYAQHDEVAQLSIVKDCLWFFMEPLVLKNEYFSFSFYKKTFENIKVCVDKVSLTRAPDGVPEEEVAGAIQNINFKIYSCCDLALGLIMSKTQNFLSREFPIQPSLPGKYYSVSKEAKENNLKNYLPSTMQFAPPKRCSLENEILSKITKSFPNNPESSPTNSSGGSSNQGAPAARGRAAKNASQNNFNQIVLVTSDNIVDDALIDEGQAANIIQLDADSNDQAIQIEQNNVVQIETNHTAVHHEVATANNTNATNNVNNVNSNDKAAGTTTSPPIIVINPSTISSSTYSNTRSRKQDLNPLNDDNQPSNKRQRVESESSVTNGSPAKAARPTRASARKGSADLNASESTNNDKEPEDGLEEDEESSNATNNSQAITRRRGRPARNPAPAAAPAQKTDVVSDGVESDQKTRKSSRISKSTTM